MLTSCIVSGGSILIVCVCAAVCVCVCGGGGVGDNYGNIPINRLTQKSVGKISTKYMHLKILAIFISLTVSAEMTSHALGEICAFS